MSSLNLTANFYEQLEYELLGTQDIAGIAQFITKYTYLAGRPFSFEGHEFQEAIVTCDAQEVNTQKIAQVGLSEVQARWGLAAVATIPRFSVIYTFPYGQDSENFSKTRVEDIVSGSPRLAALKSSANWNVAIKQLGSGYMYFKGTNSDTAALSTPADCIIADEIDRSDPDILDQYESRLGHSKWQLRRNFSTPTVERRGIDAKMRKSRRRRQLVRCCHCNHWFQPEYYKHVVLPGWDRPLDELDPVNLWNTRFKEAYLACPSCGKAPSLAPQYRRWVDENPNDGFSAVGFYVSPFDAPSMITVPKLLEKSTKYKRKSEFRNQNLGICSEESQDSITPDDLERAATSDDLRGNRHVMGCDMGMTCHIVIGRSAGDSALIVHAEKVPLRLYEERRLELIREYNVGNRVQDALPYTDMVMRLQTHEPMLRGAFYNSNTAGLFSLRDPKDDSEEELNKIRSIVINRNLAFDEFLYLVKSRQLIVARKDWTTEYFAQLQDMRKVPKVDKNGETVYVWEKSADGNDHFHHASIYMMMAAKMEQTFGVDSLIPLVSTFRVRQGA